MKNKILKYKYVLLSLAVFTAGFIYWNLPVSNVVHAQVYGVVANDGVDDTAALNSAVEVLKSRGGGKLVLPAGQIIVSDRVYFNTYGNYVSYEISGDGTEVLVNGDAGDVMFYFGNNDRVTFDGLTFVGRNVYDPAHPQYVDCGYLIFANYVDKLIIRNTTFIGIRADVSIVYTGLADTVIENSNFGGSSGRFASVEAGVTNQFDNWFRGLTVRNTTFLDYGNYRNTNYWKSSSDNSFWIKVQSGIAMRDSVNAMHQRLLRIEDCRFDEAATVSIGATNVEFVKIEGITVNVNSSGTSRAVDLNGVPYAEVNFSRFGYTGAARPAIKATNGSNVSIRGINLGGGVIQSQKDASSTVSAFGCIGQTCPQS
jgi:hypothetical protein